MSWATDYRLDWIRENVTIFGAINRSHIMAKFGVSMPQASVDLREAKKKWPDLMSYDKSGKQYVRQS